MALILIYGSLKKNPKSKQRKKSCFIGLKSLCLEKILRKCYVVSFGASISSYIQGFFFRILKKPVDVKVCNIAVREELIVHVTRN